MDSEGDSQNMGMCAGIKSTCMYSNVQSSAFFQMMVSCCNSLAAVPPIQLNERHPIYHTELRLVFTILHARSSVSFTLISVSACF